MGVPSKKRKRTKLSQGLYKIQKSKPKVTRVQLTSDAAKMKWNHKATLKSNYKNLGVMLDTNKRIRQIEKAMEQNNELIDEDTEIPKDENGLQEVLEVLKV
eukprot:TRINITY_DN4311_c0_g1_i3.p1 TRINITY_DN4311_c0_g1~~TRINITY_DN4311_c0_g1_i3.p1  ORF type:complete len:101 (-),score=30.75 TRINITY_DN4311_c0_g1_i3:251-553(-)